MVGVLGCLMLTVLGGMAADPRPLTLEEEAAVASSMHAFQSEVCLVQISDVAHAGVSPHMSIGGLSKTRGHGFT